MKVSAVVPVWNTDPLELREAADSLRRLGIVNELIFVDDHSGSPTTQTELQRQSELGAKVLINRYERTAAARCTGVFAAVGEYVLTIDADDTIRRTSVCGPLAPINLASLENCTWRPTTSLWDYIGEPRPIHNGSLIRTDLARTIAATTPNREEDLAWGYRLLLAAWRDKTPIRCPSGLTYRLRPYAGRSTDSTRCTLPQEELLRRRRKSLEHALYHLDIGGPDASAVRLWADRRSLTEPVVESHWKPGARVDTHLLSYSHPASGLRRTLDSLRDEPSNVHVVLGGFQGSIGAARAYAFTLGTAEYVSFADDDDEYVPGAMQQLVDYLDENPDCVGAYTDLEHVHASGRADIERKGPWHPVRQILYSPLITHLKVMRRSAVELYLDDVAQWPTYEEYVLTGLICAQGWWHHLPIVGARKGRSDPRKSSTRLATPNLYRKAVATITPSVMQAGRGLTGCGR